MNVPWKDPVVEAYKSGIDITLVHQSLRLTVEERLDRLVELQRFAIELRNAGDKLRR